MSYCVASAGFFFGGSAIGTRGRLCSEWYNDFQSEECDKNRTKTKQRDLNHSIEREKNMFKALEGIDDTLIKKPDAMDSQFSPN
jgi:hypothetical protein